MSTTAAPDSAIYGALRQVIDPELGCNIVDLGLIYSVARVGPKVIVKMTLTTQGCPMHESIAYGVHMALLALDGIEDVEVELVWEPRWNPAMMTPAGRAQLGIRAC
jgi:metal-sulfur cluster biosynthetic enzyme